VTQNSKHTIVFLAEETVIIHTYIHAYIHTYIHFPLLYIMLLPFTMANLYLIINSRTLQYILTFSIATFLA